MTYLVQVSFSSNIVPSRSASLIWVAIFEADRPAPNTEYPPIAERLFVCLHEFGLREDSGAAEILSDIIKAWIGTEENWEPKGGYPTSRDALDNALFRLQRYLLS